MELGDLLVSSSHISSPISKVAILAIMELGDLHKI